METDAATYSTTISTCEKVQSGKAFGIAQHGAHAYGRRFSSWYLLGIVDDGIISSVTYSEAKCYRRALELEPIGL